jgi:hypothetical protein
MSTFIQDLSLKIHDYRSDDKKIESHPLNEGFILLADNSKDSPPIKIKLTRPSLDKRTSILHNISSTTCKTVTKVKAIDPISLPTVDRSLVHVGRRLLNEPSYDTDFETSSIQTPLEDDTEIESFFKVNQEEINRQLLQIGTTSDGSGDSMF